MKRLSAVVCLFCLVASSASADRVSRAEGEQKIPVDHRAGGVLQSSGTANGLAARETAGPDTFALYGGPDELTEGKFQLANGTTADWGGGNGLPGGYGGGPDAWRPVDLTKPPLYWRQSTFNAENLNNNGPGNHAMWCGFPVGDPAIDDWVNPAGYGNWWNTSLLYVSDPVADVQVGQTVQLEFYLNYDTEITYDFVYVEYLKGSFWTEVAAFDGTNGDGLGGFPAPGVRFSDVQHTSITYDGGDYGASWDDRIQIRIRFRSDGAWSDEDGLFISQAGAVQVDDISMTNSLGSFSEDFEGSGPYLFAEELWDFVGDFADVYPRFRDIDPCRENPTPVVGFLDYGQEIRNGPGRDGTTSTGGSTWHEAQYGIPGNYITNWTGGLSFGDMRLNNEIWSPEIYLDLPGPEDDGPEFHGMRFRWSAWMHLDFMTEIVHTAKWRFAMPGEAWSPWVAPNWLFYSRTPLWRNFQQDISWSVPDGAERMQVALGVTEFCCVDPPDPGSAPSPIIDNVSVYKYRLPGPVFTMYRDDQAQDRFPVNGSIDVSSQAARDALDVPFDMGQDKNDQLMANVPGDSVVVDVVGVIPGTTVTDVRMVWALQTNALFEDAIRSAPARSKDENVVAGPSGTIWTGEVIGSESTTTAGAVVADRYFFDLPDVDFMYPGDVLHYYFKATDSDGRVSTVPYDVSSFGDFSTNSVYDRLFSMRALPTLVDALGTQPSLLVIDESGEFGDAAELHSTLGQLGYHEGVDYDTYFVRSPLGALGNGIGSAGAHGASANQLAGYSQILYSGGSLDFGLLSDGADSFNKGDDFGTLEGWRGLPGTRSIVYFGDGIATSIAQDTPGGISYLTTVMGVDWLGEDVEASIGDQLTPVVNANPIWSPDFLVPWVGDGGCPTNRTFDQIQPLAGASAGHYFTDANGVAITDPAAGVASVVHATANGFEVTVPVSLGAIVNSQGAATAPAARTAFLAEILALMGSTGGSPPVGVPAFHELALSALPNPFNPSTTVKFTAAIGSRGFVKVYNLRGELVRTLHAGEFQTQEFSWDGTDTRGASVASGVYVIRAENEGKKFNAKVALIK